MELNVDWNAVWAVFNGLLSVLASIAAVVTGVVAFLFYRHSESAKFARREKLEAYLHAEKLAGNDRGRRAVLRPAAQLRMAEAEVMEAAFASGVVVTSPGLDETYGHANCIFIVRTAKPPARPGKARI